MIKINLLPSKKTLRKQVAAEPGARDFMIGVGAIAIGAVAIFLLVDMPKRSRLHAHEDAIAQLDDEIAAKQKQLVGYAELKKAAVEADERVQSINRLNQAKVVPANVLQELGEIMTPGHLPTMTEEMARKTGNSPESDPNKRFDLAWDPGHVWITAFSDNARDGTFRLEGAAQAQVDIIQLSKRLQASAYFADVTQQSEERVSDRDTGITFYSFVITGKVAY